MKTLNQKIKFIIILVVFFAVVAVIGAISIWYFKGFWLAVTAVLLCMSIEDVCDMIKGKDKFSFIMALIFFAAIGLSYLCVESAVDMLIVSSLALAYFIYAFVRTVMCRSVLKNHYDEFLGVAFYDFKDSGRLYFSVEKDMSSFLKLLQDAYSPQYKKAIEVIQQEKSLIYGEEDILKFINSLR